MERRIAFGQELKKQRLAQDISLDEIARTTKIRKTFLEALEAGSFEDLPPADLVVTGFIRTYARHLGLDDQALVTRYREAAGAPPPPPPAPYLAVPRERRWHLWPILLGAILLAGGWSAYWVVLRRASPSPGPLQTPAAEAAPPASTSPSPPDSPPASAPSENFPADGASLTEPAGEMGDSTVPQPDDPGPLQLPASTPPPPTPEPKDRKSAPVAGDLVIEATAPCWMEVWQGSTRVVYRLAEPGERLAFNGTSFTLTLGNRSAARVTWKGAPLEPPAGEGLVVNRWPIPAPPPEPQEREP